MADHITICASCRSTGAPQGATLAERLRPLVAAEVRTTDCMILCGKPISVSFRAEGKAAYLFAEVDPESQLHELAKFAELYAASEDGILADVRDIGQLRFCLIGRLPA